MRHVYECQLRWADMDSLGHVNNVRYLDYLQEARAAMLSLHEGTTSGDPAEGVVVVGHSLTFVEPLVFRPEPVLVETWVDEVRAASFTLGYEILDRPAGADPVVYVRATTRLVPFVFGAERPRRIAPHEREFLDRYLTPTEVDA